MSDRRKTLSWLGSDKIATSIWGAIITWEFKKGKTEYGLLEVTDAVVDSGLPTDKVLKPMHSTTLFGRAIAPWKKTHVVETVEETGDYAIYQFTSKHRSVNQKADALAQQQIDYDYAAQVKLEKKSGTVTCPANPGVETAMQEAFDHQNKTRKAGDVSKVVQRAFTNCGNDEIYPICPSKGVAYFVPERHMDLVKRVQDFMIRVEARLEMLFVPRGGELDGKETVSRAVWSSVNQDFDDIEALINQLGDSSRQSTADTIAKSIQEKTFRVDANKELLGSLTEKLDERKAELAVLLTEKIGTIEDLEVPF